MSEFANKSIECNITNCANHCCCDNFCSLQKIKVGTHEVCPTDKQCTDCMSFKLQG